MERTTVTVTNGQLTDVQRANEQARFMVGLKFHAFGGGADVDDNRFTFHPRRLAIAAGVGLPKPKDDLYLGLSYDLYPGFNVNLLCQWYRNEVVDVKNGQVLETGTVYQPVPAIAVTLDSSLFTNLLKLSRYEEAPTLRTHHRAALGRVPQTRGPARLKGHRPPCHHHQ
ncbi:MAG: hypothetical protein IPG92_10880 [Flavobacteriales bacterium]|nr:hypothetical protein [Flavobacteriales bacterium]